MLISSDWNEDIATIINMILPKGSKSKAYDLMKVSLGKNMSSIIIVV